MMRKVIGVMPLYDREKKCYWIQPDYLEMLEAENAIPMLLPLTSNHNELDYFLEICGGFLLTGGPDVAPSIYNEEQKPWCGTLCEARDEMEQYILKKAVEKDRSVLGVCRGIQLMNVCYGGTLYQDLKSEYDSDLDHRIQPSYNEMIHFNTIQKDTPLYDLLGKDNYAKGIVVEDGETGIILNVYIIVGYGVKISEVVYEVQKKVKYVLETTLDIDIEAVNVFVQSIRVTD